MTQKQKLRLYEQLKNEEVSVVRGQYGLSQPAKVFDVVVGDIILIEPGMRVPADCIIYSGIDITVDESLYYEGRETIVKKQLFNPKGKRENPDTFLLKSSLVMSG